MYDRTFVIVNANGVAEIDLRRPGGGVPLEGILSCDANSLILYGVFSSVAQAAEETPNNAVLTGTVLCMGIAFNSTSFRIPDDCEQLTVYTPNAANINLRVRER